MEEIHFMRDCGLIITVAGVALVLFRNLTAFGVLPFVMWWCLPLFANLIQLGRLTAPLPLVWLALVIALGVCTAFKTHRAVEAGFKTPFLGEPE